MVLFPRTIRFILSTSSLVVFGHGVEDGEKVILEVDCKDVSSLWIFVLSVAYENERYLCLEVKSYWFIVSVTASSMLGI